MNRYYDEIKVCGHYIEVVVNEYGEVDASYINGEEVNDVDYMAVVDHLVDNGVQFNYST